MRSIISAKCSNPLDIRAPRADVMASNNRIATRFGPMIDVRHRGVLRSIVNADKQLELTATPAVVRIWSGEACRELSAHDARAMAAQLNEAALCAETLNRNG